MRILVTGATGYVGSRLVTALLADHHQVVGRHPKPGPSQAFRLVRRRRTGHSRRIRCRVGAGRVCPLQDAAGPVDVVYYLVHAIGQPGFRDADKTAAANVAAAARDAGVRRIVYLGGFVPHDETLSEHLASRAEVAQALTVEGGPELVWLGAAIIIGAGSTSFEMMRYVGDRFPVMPMPAWMDNPIEPDLHPRCAALPRRRGRRRPGARGRLRHLWARHHVVPGSAQNVCARLRAGGTRALRVPGSTRRWRRWSRASRCRCPGLAGDLVESLDHPMVASGHRPARSGARSARGTAGRRGCHCAGIGGPVGQPAAAGQRVGRSASPRRHRSRNGPAVTRCASGGSPAR